MGPIFWMLSETLYLTIHMVLALANTVAFICTCLYGSITEVWQSVRGISKIASATNTAVNHTHEVSKWRSLWNDLFSQVLSHCPLLHLISMAGLDGWSQLFINDSFLVQVFGALRTILNGLVSFLIACNRHRLRYDLFLL